MAHVSRPELLVLHTLRLHGMADAPDVARRYGVDRQEAAELLLDHEARGLVARVSYPGARGWSITAAGRDEDHRMLAEELDGVGARPLAQDALHRFTLLNARFLEAMTRWQVKPTTWDRMAANDHADWAWDDEVIGTLHHLRYALEPIATELAEALTRFDGYTHGLQAALDLVERGQRRWVDEPGVESIHAVWFRLHEDLLATLGVQRHHVS